MTEQNKEVAKLIKALNEMSRKPSIATCIGFLSKVSIADLGDHLDKDKTKHLIEVGKLIMNAQQSLLLEVKINELLGQGKKIPLLGSEKDTSDLVRDARGTPKAKDELEEN